MAFNFFADLFQNRTSNQEVYTGSNSPLLNLPEDQMLAYMDCQNIYTYWGLGKRIAHALPRFATSAPREIVIQEAPPEAVEEFKNASKKLKQDDLCYRASVFCRIYGMSGLFVAYKGQADKNDGRRNIENLTIKDVQNGKIVFNALTPLNLSGTVYNQDALSTRFQKPETIVVAGETVGSRRATVIQNNEPVYLRFSTSNFTFSGVSVFQNMVRLIKAWHRAIISLERMSTKASSIVFKEGVRGKMTGIIAGASKTALQKIKDMENDGAVSIDSNGEVTFFPLTGVQEVDAILKGLEREITQALDDTPTAILLDKSLSNGLSEGSEDMKAIIMAVNNFRKDFLDPLYALTDPYVQAYAWNDSFIVKIIKKYPDKYLGYTVSQIRQLWQESFSFTHGNIYPQSEKEVQETNKLILENIKIASELGAESADIESEINERKLFKNDITINPPPEPFPGLGDEESDEDSEEFEDAEEKEKSKSDPSKYFQKKDLLNYKGKNKDGGKENTKSADKE